MISEDLLFAYGAELKCYKPNEIIFTEGEFPLYYYQIKKGAVKLNNYNEDGKEFIQNIFSENQILGEALLFIDKAYPMNAVAMVNTEVIRLSRTRFFELTAEKPGILMDVYHSLAEGMHYKYIMLYNLSFQNPTDKLTLLMDHLKSLYHDQEPYSFQVPLTRQQLASLTGLRVETAIRTIKNMEKNKLLKIVNRKIFY